MLGKNKLLQTKGVPSFKEKPSATPSIAPVDRKEANIEAERGETILKPDGELGKFLGKKHSKTSNAGTPAQVEPGSFIFSDKIKLPKEYIATILDKDASKVSKMTPAELSLKFPTKMYLDVLRDENADKRAKNTADIMLKKSLQSLQTVFEAQQMFKEDNGIQEGTMMANGGYLPKMGLGDPLLGPVIRMPYRDPFIRPGYNILKPGMPNAPSWTVDINSPENQAMQNENEWYNTKSKDKYLFESSPEYNEFIGNPDNWIESSKGQITKPSDLVLKQYKGQNFYKNGDYENSKEGRYARINQYFDYNDLEKSVGNEKRKGKDSYNFMSPILVNDKKGTVLLPKNAPKFYQDFYKNKNYKFISPEDIKDLSKAELERTGYDGRTIYNDAKKIKKGYEFKAMFDPSNNRENNDDIRKIIDPAYTQDVYDPHILYDQPQNQYTPNTNTGATPSTSTTATNSNEPGKSKPTQIRDYVTEDMNQRKAQLYSRMFEQDRLPYMPHYNQAVPYQRANPISYAPTLAGLRAGSEQLDNSNTPDQIKGAVFSDYLSKAQEQIGKIDVQNQSNNAQVTQQNLNAFTTGINQNQQTNNQYKQNYDQLAMNQEQARTNRKYTLQDAIAELNARKAENKFDYELMNADPTSNYNVTRQNKGFKEYLNFDWKERNRLNTINSNMLDQDQFRKMFGADVWDGASNDKKLEAMLSYYTKTKKG